MNAKTLQTLAQQTKTGILTSIAEASDSVLVQVQVAVLDALENRIREAGMDPRHPCFGPDVRGALTRFRETGAEAEIIEILDLLQPVGW